MDGAYKVKLDTEQLRAAVYAVFECEMASFVELKEGWANSAYSIELEDGRKVVLKARPSAETKFMRYEVDLMRTEVTAMRKLFSDKRLPIPRIYEYDTSMELLPVEYFIMEHMEGTPYNQVKNELSEEERNAIDRRLGELNRFINEQKGEAFGSYAGATHSHWRDAFAGMIFGVLEDGKDASVSLSISYEELEREIELRLPMLDEVSEARLLHWDLWDGNVFVKNGQVSGIIDFERAMWGDPLMEHYFSHFNRSDAFCEGYGLIPNEPEQIARRKLYDLYLDLILYIECAYRKYDNEDHVKWAHDNLVESLKRFRLP
jgi:aminoglycoside phosphotransferase (APT) family kinase protein